MEGLTENDLDHYTHLLTGYVGSASFLNQIPILVNRLKEKNPNLIYGKYKYNCHERILSKNSS